jgi:hypothetical protein
MGGTFRPRYGQVLRAGRESNPQPSDPWSRALERQADDLFTHEPFERSVPSYLLSFQMASAHAVVGGGFVHDLARFGAV